jgi:transposase-like protein
MPKEQSPGKPTTRRYSEQEKAAAVRLVRTLRAELGTEHGTVKRVADQLGYGTESVRLWVRQADIDDGHEPVGFQNPVTAVSCGSRLRVRTR